jgi:hypothetical protein
MGVCPRCTELEDALEHLVAKYWAASGRNQRLVSTDREKRKAEMLELTAKDAVDEGWKSFQEHKQSAHPDVVE